MKPPNPTLSLYPHTHPQHTPGHIDCPACELARRDVMKAAEFGALRFSMAAPLWLSWHRQDISDRTAGNYEYYFRSLNRFFGELPLRDIHNGHITEYQKQRTEKVEITTLDGRKKQIGGAGPWVVNHEVNALAQILHHAGLWEELKKFYKPVRHTKREKYGPGRALTTEEEERLVTVACSKPRWKVAFLCSLIQMNTSAGPGEICGVRLRDVNVDGRVLRIREAIKNEYRERDIWMNDTVHWAAQLLLRRAHVLGANDPDHYLLPYLMHKRGMGYDPTRPMKSWRSAWNSLRDAAGLPKLRRYDLRHHSLTKLAEKPFIAERTIEQIGGQVSEATKKRYRHLRMQTQIEALSAIETKPPKAVKEMESMIPAPKWLKFSK
jgi:integrase